MKPANEKSKILSPNLFPVVGIGASAGGLEAFKKLLKAIPENSGMAYVLVQHLDPDRESLLPGLLQKGITIPVLEISDDIKVEPNHIYIIPSNKMLEANDGILQLSPRPEKAKNERNLPIDLFFISLAEVHQTHAIGVILSGTASDGTLGLKAIKDHGGITFAQDEKSAAYEGMPHNAMMAGVVDFILPPEEIPGKLLALKQQINRSDEELQNSPQADEDVFKQILSLLRIRKGTDFTYYKQTTIRRRILRRVALNKNETPAGYLKYLRENKGEQDILYQDLLIPVTAFFRDTKVFDNLCKSVFPHIIKNETDQSPVRIWVAGCSTGEEAYSMAICLKEFLGDKVWAGPNQKVQIFATDISEPAIEKARKGIYTKNDVAGLSPQRLTEFFTKGNGNYHISKEVRDMCVFSVHNFLKDPPFSRMDFISCRNVLIYMGPYLQKKALTTFHYALNAASFLLLGKSETSNNVPDLFVSADKSDKLYTRKDVPGKLVHEKNQRNEQVFKDLTTNTEKDKINPGFQKAADDIVLSKYAPAGVIVNDALDIVHFRGNTNSYLEQSSGKPSHNLLKMAKEGFAFELRNILHKVKKDKAPVLKENIPLQSNEGLINISIEAIPLSNTIEPYYLILFHDNKSPGKKQSVKGNNKTTAGKLKKDEKELRIQQLELELAQTREDMRSITEDQEAANEELQSANEELLSSGEELQSLNEELETGKEELQSTNEELTVVNQEMISLNEQVTIARNYAQNIIANIRESLLVLDKNQRVVTANNAFYKTFRVNERETEGILIYDLGNKQWNIPELRILLEKILPEKSTFNDFEVTHTFSTIGERVMLLNARAINENTEEKLILLSIEDITERRKAENVLNKASQHLQHLVMGLPAGVYSCDAQGHINFYNDAAAKLWGREPQIGQEQWCGSWKIFKPDGTPVPLDSCPMAVTVKEGRAVDGEEIIIERYDGTRSNVLVYPQPQFNLSGELTGAINMVFDITEQVKAKRQIEESEERFRNLVEQALSPICIFKGEEMVLEVANDPVFKIWNVGKEALGKPFLEIVPEMKDQPFMDLLLDVLRKGVTHRGNEWPAFFVQKNGEKEKFYFNFVFQPYREHDKTISGVFVLANDVTEQVIAKNRNLESQELRNKELEEKVQQRTVELNEANELLQKKNEELIKMNKELESFTYISSHDLQEPLRKIQTFSNRILTKEYPTLSDKGKGDFSRIQDAASRMQKLIEDLLAYSRTNVTEHTFENTSINDIVEITKTDLAEMIMEKNAAIKTTGSVSASINPSQFRQVLNNLIGNALKFSRTGLPSQISIKSEIGEGEQFQNENTNLTANSLSRQKKYYHLSVSDNGIGFDPQYKDQIFEVFQRLYGKDEYPGTGIGLAIVKKIVENHNGVITAKGEPDKGATFDIYIPS